MSDAGCRISDAGCEFATSGIRYPASGIRHAIFDMSNDNFRPRLDIPLPNILFVFLKHFAEADVEPALPQRVHKNSHRRIRRGCEPRYTGVRTQIKGAPAYERSNHAERFSKARNHAWKYGIVPGPEEHCRHAEFFNDSRQIRMRPVPARVSHVRGRYETFAGEAVFVQESFGLEDGFGARFQPRPVRLQFDATLRCHEVDHVE